MGADNSTEKKKWYFRWYMIVLYVFVGLVILGGLMGGETESGSSSGTQTAQASPAAQVKNDLPCRPIIPERIKLECRDNLFSANNPAHVECAYVNYTFKLAPDGFQILETGNPINYYWADGETFGTWASNLKFWAPNQPGENANYLYIQTYLGYGKENVASDGTILQPTEWTIKIAVDPKDKTDIGYKIVQYSCSGTGIDRDDVRRSKWLPMN